MVIAEFIIYYVDPRRRRPDATEWLVNKVSWQIFNFVFSNPLQVQNQSTESRLLRWV